MPVAHMPSPRKAAMVTALTRRRSIAAETIAAIGETVVSSFMMTGAMPEEVAAAHPALLERTMAASRRIKPEGSVLAIASRTDWTNIICRRITGSVFETTAITPTGTRASRSIV